MQYVSGHDALREVYDFLKRCNYDSVMQDWAIAYDVLSSARNYVDRRYGQIIAWVAYHNFMDESCDVDICVSPEWHKRWLKAKVAKEILERPFTLYGMRQVTAIAWDSAWEQSLLRFGFVKGYKWAGECVFTHKEYLKKFGHCSEQPV